MIIDDACLIIVAFQKARYGLFLQFVAMIEINVKVKYSRLAKAVKIVIKEVLRVTNNHRSLITDFLSVSHLLIRLK